MTSSSSPSWTTLRGRIGGMSSRPNRPDDDPELLWTRRELRYVRLREHITKVLAGEPALTTEQLEDIAALLLAGQ